METTELAKLIGDINQGIEKMKAEGATKNDLNKMQTELEKVKGLADLTEKQAEKIKGLELAVSELAGKLENHSPKAAEKTLTELVGEAVNKVKEFEQTKTKGFAKVGDIVRAKTVGNMTISANSTAVERTNLPGIKLIPRNTFVLRSLSNVGSNTTGLVRWIEEKTPEGAGGVTSEGSTKNQVDANLVEATATVRKITAFVKVSTEMLADIAQIESYINGKLMYEIEKAEEAQLLTGDGNAPNLNGITKYAQDLDLAAVQNIFDLNKSNRWDAIGAAVTQITEANHIPNAILMRPSDVYSMVHASRTTTGEYNYPVVVNGDGTFVWGIPVIQTMTIPAGYFLVADMTKFNISDRESLSIEMGFDGNDFTNNFVTIRAEKRLATFAASEDKEAFIYETFADAKLWLEKNT